MINYAQRRIYKRFSINRAPAAFECALAVFDIDFLLISPLARAIIRWSSRNVLPLLAPPVIFRLIFKQPLPDSTRRDVRARIAFTFSAGKIVSESDGSGIILIHGRRVIRG